MVARKRFELRHNIVRRDCAKHDGWSYTITEVLMIKKNRRIILLNGPSSSGKSSLACSLKTLLEQKHLNYQVVSIDDFMKLRTDEKIYEDDVFEISSDMCDKTIEYLKTSDGVIIDHVITSERIFEQLLEALKYLESKGLMHRDIKLDNILLDENLNAKISDFGISALYPQANNPNNQGDFIFSKFTTVGRRDFVAPEIFSHNYDFRVDIYGLGLTMLCLMSKMNPISIDENGKRNINTELIYEGYNKYLRILVLTMILKKELRPDAREALNQLNFIKTKFINSSIDIIHNKDFRFTRFKS